MTTIINWAKLVRENRAKAYGIPWTKAELKAIHDDGMDPEEVRNGFLNKEDSVKEASLPQSEKKLKYMNRAELIKIAKEIGINFDELVVTRGDLILEIEKVREVSGEDNAIKPQDSPLPSSQGADA